MTGHDSILAAINDASDVLDQFDNDETGISVEVPITALRWLVHAASMHYTHTYTNQTGDDTVYRIASTMNDRFRDQMLDHGTLVEVAIRRPDTNQDFVGQINRDRPDVGIILAVLAVSGDEQIASPKKPQVYRVRAG